VQSPEVKQVPVTGIASITNVIIDTSPEPYRYSVFMDADSRITQHFRGDGFIIVEISLKVIAGQVGIVWVDETYNPLESTERYVSAAPAVQRILLSVPSWQAHRLVFRNVANDSTKATFRIAGIRAKVVGDSFRQATSEEADVDALYL